MCPSKSKNKMPLPLLSLYHFSYNSKSNTTLFKLISHKLNVFSCLYKNALYWGWIPWSVLYLTLCNKQSLMSVFCMGGYYTVLVLLNCSGWLCWSSKLAVFPCSFCSEFNVFMVTVCYEAYIIPDKYLKRLVF